MCNAKIRPMRPVSETELQCELETGHPGMHSAVLRDYAWPGSETVTNWLEDDRRTFHGEFALCEEPGCILPDDHRGNHAF